MIDGSRLGFDHHNDLFRDFRQGDHWDHPNCHRVRHSRHTVTARKRTFTALGMPARRLMLRAIIGADLDILSDRLRAKSPQRKKRKEDHEKAMLSDVRHFAK